MEHTNHTNNEQLVAELQNTEKALKAAETLRMRAVANKGAYENQLKDNEAELKQLGTTAEQAEVELETIDRQSAELLEKVNGLIPYDLLQRYKMI